MEDKQNEMLKAENELLKRKIAESGFYSSSDDAQINVPPDLENDFLKNIIQFEDQFDLNKKIKIFEKIGKPQHFKPVNEVPDAEIESAWQNVSAHLHHYGIDLSVCSPNITSRELYRFATEEFFELEIDDIDVPGMINGFIYDEFYPDLEYDNSRTAVEDCIGCILGSQPLEYMYFMGEGNIRLNEYYPLAREEFKQLIRKFKSSYPNLELLKAAHTSVASTEKTCIVTGFYEATATFERQMLVLTGNWTVAFELIGTYPNWCIVNVQINGIQF